MLNLTPEEVQAIRESIKHSKFAVSNGSAPKGVKDDRLDTYDSILKKLAGMKAA